MRVNESIDRANVMWARKKTYTMANTETHSVRFYTRIGFIPFSTDFYSAILMQIALHFCMNWFDISPTPSSPHRYDSFFLRLCFIYIFLSFLLVGFLFLRCSISFMWFSSEFNSILFAIWRIDVRPQRSQWPHVYYLSWGFGTNYLCAPITHYRRFRLT